MSSSDIKGRSKLHVTNIFLKMALYVSLSVSQYLCAVSRFNRETDKPEYRKPKNGMQKMWLQ